MAEQVLVPRIVVNIDGVDYSATYFVEDKILYAVINGESFSRATTAETAETVEATVRAMMMEEALRDKQQRHEG